LARKAALGEWLNIMEVGYINFWPVKYAGFWPNFFYPADIAGNNSAHHFDFDPVGQP